MTPTELRALCAKRQLDGNPPAHIYIKMPGRRWPSSGKRFLAGRWSPLGDIAGDAPGGGMVVRFRSDEVLAWLDKMEAKP